MEIPYCPETKGRVRYRWVERYVLLTPDGGEIHPPMKLSEARKHCKDSGWELVESKRP